LRVEISETGDYPRDTVSFTPVLYGRPVLRELELTVNGRAVTRPLQPGQREWLCQTLPVLA
jgi:alpha-glucosidase